LFICKLQYVWRAKLHNDLLFRRMLVAHV
jgi:hypothetical protein